MRWVVRPISSIDHEPSWHDRVMQRDGSGPADRDFGRDSRVWMKRSEIKPCAAGQELSVPVGHVPGAFYGDINPRTDSPSRLPTHVARRSVKSNRRPSRSRRFIVVVVN